MLSPESPGAHHPARSTVHLALFTVALLFSINYIVSKFGMREMAPLSFAWLRVAAAALILAGLFRRSEPLAREDAWLVAKFGVLGVAVNATLFLVGLSMTTVQVSAILITTIPVFTHAAAIVARTERASAHRIGGIVLAGAGALLVVGGESFHGTLRSVVGALLIVINCLSYSLYLVISKPHMVRLSARTVVARMFLVGAILLLPVASVSLWRENWTSITPGAWLALAFVVVGPTILAYLLNAWALRYADSSVVAAYTYAQPILAGLLAVLFLGERLRPILVVAAAMIFAGVWLAQREPSFTSGRT